MADGKAADRLDLLGKGNPDKDLNRINYGSLMTVAETIIPTTGEDASIIVNEACETSNGDAICTEPLDWEDEKNLHNPYNWSVQKKQITIILISFIELLTHITSMMFAPTIPEMQREFRSSNTTLATFSMTIYVLGFSVGPLIFAPLSELYGRLALYMLCLTMFLVLNIACALSSSLEMLITFRFFAGSFGAAPVAIGGAMVADMVRVEKRGAAMALYQSGPIIGNLIGPPLGGLIAQYKSWRWVFWIMTILAASTLAIGLLILRETHAPTLLRRFTQIRSSPATNEDTLPLNTNLKIIPKLARTIRRPLLLLLSSPIVFISGWLIALIVGIMNLLFASLGRIFQEQYMFSSSASGLVYLATTTGFVLAAFVFAKTSDKIASRLKDRNDGQYQSEFRLPLMMLAIPTITVGLCWYGWAAEKRAFWFVPVVGLNLVGLGITTLQTYLVDSFGEFAASALAASTIMRSLGGALIPLVGPILYQRLGLGWGNSLLALLSLVFCFVPCLLYWKGTAWRAAYAPKNM